MIFMRTATTIVSGRGGRKAAACGKVTAER
jgi:hypothetical protein